MSLVMNKRETDAILEVLRHEHASDTIKAIELMKAFEEIFKERAKFVVVGQRVASREGPVAPADGERVALGWFSTPGDATKAADSLWSNTATGDRYSTWVLPCWHGTPADFHKEQKARLLALELKTRDARFEKIRASIEQRRREIQEIADGERNAAG